MYVVQCRVLVWPNASFCQWKPMVSHYAAQLLDRCCAVFRMHSWKSLQLSTSPGVVLWITSRSCTAIRLSSWSTHVNTEWFPSLHTLSFRISVRPPSHWPLIRVVSRLSSTIVGTLFLWLAQHPARGIRLSLVRSLQKKPSSAGVYYGNPIVQQCSGWPPGWSETMRSKRWPRDKYRRQPAPSFLAEYNFQTLMQFDNPWRIHVW